jgi:hypothetical protein
VPVLLLDQIKLFDVLGKTYPQENPRGSVRSVLEGLIEHALGPYFAETTLSQACDREEAIWDFEVSVTRRIAVVNWDLIKQAVWDRPPILHAGHEVAVAKAVGFDAQVLEDVVIWIHGGVTIVICDQVAFTSVNVSGNFHVHSLSWGPPDPGSNLTYCGSQRVELQFVWTPPI